MVSATNSMGSEVLKGGWVKIKKGLRARGSLRAYFLRLSGGRVVLSGRFFYSSDRKIQGKACNGRRFHGLWHHLELNCDSLAGGNGLGFGVVDIGSPRDGDSQTAFAGNFRFSKKAQLGVGGAEGGV